MILTKSSIYNVVFMYHGNLITTGDKMKIERVQTGMRMEKKLVKVLKALAEYLDLSLGDLMEGIVLHAFDGITPFSDETLKKIASIKEIYNFDLNASHSHKLKED